jgi:hypothetical protein
VNVGLLMIVLGGILVGLVIVATDGEHPALASGAALAAAAVAVAIGVLLGFAAS